MVLFKTFDSIKELSSSIEEDFGYLTFKGKCKNISNYLIIESIEDELQSLAINNSITYQVDKSSFKKYPEFKENLYIDCYWTITINKVDYIDKIGYTFFYQEKSFIEWSDRILVFDPNNIFNKKEKVKIIVNGIQKTFGGPNILICGLSDSMEFEKEIFILPLQTTIKTIVHSTANEDIQINPLNNLITFGENNKYSASFFERSAITLASCLCNEINSKNSIIIRGVRRLNLSIAEKAYITNIKIADIKSFVNAITWVYEERIDLRLKLLLERITLDIDYTKPYVTGLIAVIESSLQQARERYSFIIYDRKDEYQKELRELLKDLRNLTELYSSKVRMVLNNVLRDILATLVLIGFSFFTKITEIKLLSENQLLTPLFRIFAIYFLISVIFQTLTDWYDIRRTRKEFVYWKDISREYITPKDFDNHMKRTVNKRRNGTVVIYTALAIIYISLSVLCWNFKTIFEIIMR